MSNSTIEQVRKVVDAVKSLRGPVLELAAFTDFAGASAITAIVGAGSKSEVREMILELQSGADVLEMWVRSIVNRELAAHMKA